jgi:hypothetical protein
MKLGRKGKSADLFEAIKTEVEEPLLRSPVPSASAPVPTIPQERYVTNISIVHSIEIKLTFCFKCARYC